MEYGIWLSKYGSRNNFHTLKECRHHGLQEFFFLSNKKRPDWRCLECHRQDYKGVRTSKISGCANTIGLIIAEAILRKAFKVMVKAHPMESYDFICGQGFKVDSKCSTLHICNNKIGQRWLFNIGRNKVPNAFCLIALDNLPEVKPEDAKPVHVWLIPGDAVIDGRVLNDRVCLAVTPRTIARLEPWRRTDMEGRIIKCCEGEH